MKDNIIFISMLIVGVVFIYLFGNYFFGLVGDLYHLLDGFLWAFFAGIIAFFAAIAITGLIVQLTTLTVSVIIFLTAFIFTLFERN